MSLSSGDLSAADVAAVVGNGNNGFGNWGDGGYYGGSMGNMGGQSMRQEPYGYRMNPQMQDDMVRQTMNKLYN